ncbi:MAG TPA: four helix bundle protein [Bryobacteraceae bacterium]
MPGSVPAVGSASELEYHLVLAKDLELMKSSDHERLDQSATVVKRMLTALILKLKADG